MPVKFIRLVRMGSAIAHATTRVTTRNLNESMEAAARAEAHERADAESVVKAALTRHAASERQTDRDQVPLALFHDERRILFGGLRRGQWFRLPT
jgi:hypothetical protein